MTSRDFVYWLQGLFELGKPTELNAEQTELVKRHLALVFKHEIDPSAGDEEHQQELNEVHAGKEELRPPFHGMSPFDYGGNDDGKTYRC